MVDYPTFNPDQREEIYDFFREQKFAVVSDAMTSPEMQFLRAFVDRSKREIPREWGPDKHGVYSHGQILINYPELDPFVRPAVAFPLVDAIMGPETRFAQFDFRDVSAEAGERSALAFHKDRAHTPREDGDPNRDFDSTYVCAIHYLTDVEAENPCFCVVPRSHPYESQEVAKDRMGETYREVEIRGPAGTAVLYDIAIFHTRVPGKVSRGRLTQHSYFSRAQSPPLTKWVMIPKRLAENPDPEQRAFFSQWTGMQKGYVEAGYSREYYEGVVMDKAT